MPIKCFDRLQIRTPNFEFLIVGASYDHSRVLNISNLSNDIIMGKLNPLDLCASVPVPQVEGLVLRATHNVIASMTIENSHCVFVLGVFTDHFVCI
jgi:hypothetical protein